MVKLYELRYQSDYIAKLREHDDECSEIVFHRGAQIHIATFPTKNLGSACRSEYLACMVASIAREHRAVTPITEGK